MENNIGSPRPGSPKRGRNNNQNNQNNVERKSPKLLMKTDPGIGSDDRRILEPSFWILAKSDFRHDFSHTKMKDLLNAIPLDSIQTFTNRLIQVKQLTLKAADKTVFDFFEEHIHKIFSSELRFSGNEPKSGYYNDEEKVIEYISGLDMKRIKSGLMNSKTDYVEIGTINRPFDTFSRNYVVNAVRYKKDHKKGCLSKAINKLLGSSTITFVVDASFLPITSIQDAAEEEYRGDYTGTAVPLTVNILENMENKGDSAGKILHSTFKGPSDVSVSFYEDLQEKNYYPAFQGGEGDQNANIYASIPFSTHKEGTGIRGEFDIGENKIVIEDIQNASEISSASLKAVQLYIEEYAKVKISDEKMKEILVQFLIKRLGDWAQGLSLLDLLRLYRSDDSTKSLNEIKGDGEMGVLTHDQILLAYSIFIGVDVFFTMKFGTGDHWLLHFKNNSAGGGITEERKKKELSRLSDLEDSIAEEIKEGEKAIDDLVAQLNGLTLEGNFGEYIRKLRIATTKLTSLSSIQDLKNLELERARAEKSLSELDIKDSFAKKLVLSSSIVCDTIDETLKKNRTVRKSNTLGEEAILTNLMNAMKRGGNVLISIAYQNYLEKLVYPIRDDIALLKREYGIKIPVAPEELAKELFGIEGRTRVAYMTDNLKNIRKTLDMMMPQVAGGGRDTLQGIFDDIRDRRIFVIKKNKYDEECDTNLPGTKKDKSADKIDEFIAIQGNYVSDRNMNLYSVLDKYIITEDDRGKFQHLNAQKNDSYQYKYCKMRELLLEHDRLYTIHMKLKSNFYEHDDEKTKSLENDINDLYDNLKLLIKHGASRIPDASPPVKTRANTVFKSHGIEKRLANIRSIVFTNYIFVGKPLSHVLLDEIEMDEAARTLASLSREERTNNQEWDKETMEEIKKLVDELVVMKSANAGLFRMNNAEGGRRTRRAKKAPKRKTRRHK